MVAVRLKPAGADAGVIFRRTDLGRDIAASVAAVTEVDHATTLTTRGPRGSASVRTVEHLMAALHGLGVDNCIVEIDGDEVPILDGSALPWVRVIQSVGTRSVSRARKVRRVVRPFTVATSEASITAHPADELRITALVEFPHPAIGRQEWSFTVTPESFAHEVAAARTFGFLEEVEALRRNGLIRGASMDNAVVLDDRAVVSGPLRFADEFARHKALDLLGDLALMGTPLLGHFVARRAGHRLHVEFARQLLASSAWTLETLGATKTAHAVPGVLTLAGARANYK